MEFAVFLNWAFIAVMTVVSVAAACFFYAFAGGHKQEKATPSPKFKPYVKTQCDHCGSHTFPDCCAFGHLQ
jgi:hypothetical protein